METVVGGRQAREERRLPLTAVTAGTGAVEQGRRLSAAELIKTKQHREGC